MTTELSQLKNYKYICVESFRKNGTPVRTPMWFAEENGVLYVYSLANAGKVKRIRNNPKVRVAPCNVTGVVKGDWIETEARILDDAGAQHGHQLLNRKYWTKGVGDFFSKLRKRERVVIAMGPSART
jgi:PPOX class probable F420-dependent enzyme